MVQVTVSGGGELQGSEANVVERLVVDAVRFVGVLNQLVDRERRVVGLDDGVRDLKDSFNHCGLNVQFIVFFNFVRID